MNQSLFVYGTLRIPEIISRLLQRPLSHETAILEGFQCTAVSNAPFPGIQPAGGHQTQGILYTGLTNEEMQKLDLYEGDLFQRINATVQTASSSRKCWVYIIKPQHRGQLSKQAWSLEGFEKNHLEQFLNVRSRTIHWLYTK